MNNEIVWKEILSKKEITTKDRILFRTIQDILSSVFTNDNHISVINVGYKINEHLYAWFPNITPEKQRTQDIANGYGSLCHMIERQFTVITTKILTKKN